MENISSVPVKDNSVYHGDKSSKMSKFLDNERHTNVRFVNGAFYISDNNKPTRVSGLLPLLKRLFWPNYNYMTSSRTTSNHASNNGTLSVPQTINIKRPLLRKQKGPQPAKKKKPATWNDFCKVSPGGTLRKIGKERGKIVHEQLCDYARLPQDKFLLKYDFIDSYTLKIMLALQIWKLVPVFGELNIYNENIGFGTAIDLLCIDATTGNIVIVEVKTGYDKTFLQADCKLGGPLSVLKTGSPRTRAFIQLLFMELTLIYKYNLSPNNVSSILIQAQDDGVSCHFIPGDIRNLQTEIYKYACENKRVKKKKIPPNSSLKRKYV